MHGRVDLTDDREPITVGDSGRHRGRRPMPAPLALGLTVVALLTAFGAGAALLPGSFTGSGAQAETPAAAIANLAPGAGGAGDGSTAPAAGPAADTADGTATTTATDPAGTDPAGTAPSSAPAPKATPKVTKAPVPKAAPKPKQTRTSKPKPKAAAPKVGSGQVAQENEVIRLTNVERAKVGCGKVTLNTKLRTAMRRHTQDMADNNYFSHDSQDGRSPWDRAKSAGYQTPIGENIAKGQTNAAAVMDGWMNSPGHRSNIVNCDAKAIGVGLSYDGGTPIWGQLFGSA